MHSEFSTRTPRVIRVALVAGALVPIPYSWYLYEALDGPGDVPRAG